MDFGGFWWILTGICEILSGFWWILVDFGGFWVIFSGFMWCERAKNTKKYCFCLQNYVFLTNSSAQANQVCSQQGKTAAGRQLWSANHANQAKTTEGIFARFRKYEELQVL